MLVPATASLSLPYALSLSLSNLERNTACNQKARNQSKNPRLAADVIPQTLTPACLMMMMGSFKLSQFCHHSRTRREVKERWVNQKQTEQNNPRL
jgi:hypothetical protein